MSPGRGVSPYPDAMEPIQRALKDPKKSDQRPGEQTVQVNDSYESSKESVDSDPSGQGDQHSHGG